MSRKKVQGSIIASRPEMVSRSGFHGAQRHVFLALVIAVGCFLTWSGKAHSQGPAVKESPAPAAPAPPDLTVVEVSIEGLSVRAEGVSLTNKDDVQLVIEDQLKVAGDPSMSEPLADDLSFFLRQRYLDLGYVEAVVDWNVQNRVAVLKVEEGPRYTVGNITFEGNTTQDSKELTTYLLRPTHEKLGANDGHPPLVEADIKAGASLVQRSFQAQGYLDAVVSEPRFIMRRETKTQDIILKIVEGPRYDIGAVSVTGEWEERKKEVNASLEGLSGQPFSEVKIESTRKSIIGIFQQRGYFAAEVVATAYPERQRGGGVPVQYEVRPGKRFRVVGISVAPGFSKGAERLVRSSFKRSVDKVYSPPDLELMHRQALDSEIFSRLDVTPRRMTDDTLTLELSGEEGKTRTLAAYAGFETFRGAIIGAEFRKVNIFNSGNSAQIKAELTSVGINGGIKLFDPAILNSPYTLNLSLDADSQEIFDYERNTIGTRATLSRQWTRNISTRVFAEFSVNEADSAVLTPEELGPDKYNLGLVGLAAILDFRDSPVLPTKGWVFNASIAGTAGGDISYTRSDVSFAFYRPITKKFRTAMVARTSAIQPERELSSVPIDLRLFNGGANSVRSFQEREMGLRSDSGTPLGGTLSQTFSVEFSYEVVNNLELAVFGDMGTLSRIEDSVFSRPEDLRYAIGLGIRYKLPVGPLRIDYGYNPDRQEGEDVGALHLTFGFAF